MSKVPKCYVPPYFDGHIRQLTVPAAGESSTVHRAVRGLTGRIRSWIRLQYLRCDIALLLGRVLSAVGVCANRYLSILIYI